MFRAIVCYSHSRSARTQSKQKKAIQSIHDGVGDTGSLQVSLHAFSEATLVRHLVVLRIRFTVYRYVDLPTVRSYLYVDLVFSALCIALR